MEYIRRLYPAHAAGVELIHLYIYYIEPRANEQYKAFDFNHYEDIYRIGYEAAKEYIQTHPKLAALGKK